MPITQRQFGSQSLIEGTLQGGVAQDFPIPQSIMPRVIATVPLGTTAVTNSITWDKDNSPSGYVRLISTDTVTFRALVIG